MTIEEIRKIECDRQEPEKFGVIHLISDGGFYRAHDWSAWLMTSFPFGEAVNKPLKISAKRLKDGYIAAWVGFPVASIGKYVPNDGSITFAPVSDTQIDVMIALPEEYQNADSEALRKNVDEWKEQLPMNESKKQKREDREVADAAPRVMRISDVLGRILSFPLESKSPLDAYEFLRQLRQQVVAMF